MFSVMMINNMNIKKQRMEKWKFSRSKLVCILYLTRFKVLFNSTSQFKETRLHKFKDASIMVTRKILTLTLTPIVTRYTQGMYQKELPTFISLINYSLITLVENPRFHKRTYHNWKAKLHVTIAQQRTHRNDQTSTTHPKINSTKWVSNLRKL